MFPEGVGEGVIISVDGLTPGSRVDGSGEREGWSLPPLSLGVGEGVAMMLSPCEGVTRAGNGVEEGWPLLCLPFPNCVDSFPTAGFCDEMEGGVEVAGAFVFSVIKPDLAFVKYFFHNTYLGLCFQSVLFS